MYVLTPFIDGGEMFDWVAETGASPEDRIRPLFRQLVEGMRVSTTPDVVRERSSSR